MGRNEILSKGWMNIGERKGCGKVGMGWAVVGPKGVRASSPESFVEFGAKA
jgi:hypothetical protein